MNIQETETDSTLSQLLAPGATGLACNWIIFLLDWPHNKRRAQLQKKLQKTQKIRKRQCTWQSCFTCCCIGFMVYVFFKFFLYFFFCSHCIGGDCVAFFTFAFNSQMLSVDWGDGDEDEVVIRQRFFGICFGFLKLPLFT